VRYASSLVIDSLCDQAWEGDIAVAGLYCDFLARREQTATNMIGAILKELVHRGGIPGHVREAFQMGMRGYRGRGPRIMDLLGMLRTTVASISQVFICIDALDECHPRELFELLTSLREIIREFPAMRIFLTGRPHMVENTQGYFPKAIVVPMTTKTEDIRNYLQMRLGRDDEPEAMDSDLRVDIMGVMLETVPDT